MIHSVDDSRASLQLYLPAETDTLALGAALARGLSRGLQMHLVGDLGAGKTTLVRALLRAAGYSGKVKSPTFTLVELYAISSLDLYHFDFYRFNQAEEYLDAGLDEYFSGNAVCVVEWPDKSMPYLPSPDVVVTLRVVDDGRLAELAGCTERGRSCLAAMPPVGRLQPSAGAAS